MLPRSLRTTRRTPPTATSAPDPSIPTAPVPTSPNDPSCGMHPDDWCASPARDSCGVHKNVDQCRKDKKCRGMPYHGESVVACRDDGSGFAANCPTVGCISR
jgi:hypothetical protein